MKKNIFFIILLFLLSQMSFAQKEKNKLKIISGTVSDALGTLPGVTVIIKGTFRGVETSMLGEYYIQAKDGDILVFRFVGMKTVEKKITADTHQINVNMEEDTNILEEVIVTGQGSGIEKRKLSTTVDVLTSKDLEKSQATRIDQLLQSTMPGAQIKMGAGRPGAPSIIRTRGPISVASSTTPVIIVDGVRVDNLNSNSALDFGTGGSGFSALGDIPMESVEKIEYIKGGAATTLYGADAANGVIQIITKKGKAGETNVFIESKLGIVMGTTDFLRFDRTAEALFRPGISQEYRMGINGGNEGITYNFSGSLLKDESYTKINDLIKRAVSFGLNAQVTKKLGYQGSFSFTNLEIKNDYNANDGFSRFGEFEKGKRGNLDTMTQEEWEKEIALSEKKRELIDIDRSIMRFTNSNKFTYKVSENFSGTATIGLDYRDEISHRVQNNAFKEVMRNKKYSNEAELIRVSRKNLVVTGDLNLTYKFDWKGLSSTSILGGQFFRTNDKQLRLTASQGIDVGKGTYTTEPYEEKKESYLVLQNANYGLYFLQNIGINDIAFIELGGRVDKNTSAGENTSPIFLPKAGIIYNFSDHNFYKKGSFSNYLSLLKLRANYGEATNFARPFSQLETMSVGTLIEEATLSFNNLGNKDLVSERLKTYEFGVDIGLFRRITMGLTYYISNTTDALFTPNSMPSSGNKDQIKNIGEIENKGLEFALNSTLIKGTNHNLSFNASYNYNQNKVVKMDNTAAFRKGGFGVAGSWIEEGESLGVLKGTITEKQKDGTYKTTSNSYLGDSFAPHFGSFGLNYSYKNFNFFTTGDYQFGGKVINLDLYLRHKIKVDDAGVPSELSQNMKDPKPSTYVNYFVFDNDFVKIRNIGATYDLKRALKYFSNIRIGFTVTNPFNWSPSGIDPEVSGSGINRQNSFSSGGFYYATQSAPRIYMSSIKFQF